MLPNLRPGQVFPRPCAEYTSHLGEHQAAAFSALWNLHDDPKNNVAAAARHIYDALGAPARDGSVKVAPMELRVELHAGIEKVDSMYEARTASAMDIEYMNLFAIVAGWDHEIVRGNIDAFILDVNYE